MPTVKRPLRCTADPALQQLLATPGGRLPRNRRAVVARAIAELARRAGLAVPAADGRQHPGLRRAAGRVIADPPGPIGGRRSRV